MSDPLGSFEKNAEKMSLWLLPYGNLMVILMILFASLYSLASTNSLEYETAMADLASKDKAERAKKDVKLARDLKGLIKKLGMEGKAEVTINANAIKLKLSSPVIFESGSAELKPDIMPLMAELLNHLKDMENTIIVEGHTDNVPIHGGLYASNWELSAARAFSVIYFYLQRDIAPSRLLAYGYGEQRPFFHNETELGRAMNRRIEITILRGGQ